MNSADIYYCETHGMGFLILGKGNPQALTPCGVNTTGCVFLEWGTLVPDSNLLGYIDSLCEIRADGWEIPYFLQEVYGQDGEQIDDVPQWLEDLCKKK